MLHRLVLCLTYACNLECAYCYNHRLTYGYQGPSVMTPDTARLAVRSILRRVGKIHLVQFFGGEPNLAADTMASIVKDVQRTWSLQGTACPTFGVVTNLAHLTPAIIDLYSEHNFQVTVSLDGEETIHDQLRPFAGGGGSHQRVLGNLSCLQRVGIPFSVECTYTALHFERGVTPSALLQYFSGIGARRADIVCVMAPPGSPLYLYKLSERTIASLFVDAVDSWFDYWLSGGHMQFGIVAEIISRLREPTTHGRFCPAGRTYLAISPAGVVYPCHLLIEEPRYKIGTLESDLWAGHYPRPIDSTVESCQCLGKDMCLACPARNRFYTGSTQTPFPPDCSLKCAVFRRILQRIQTMPLANPK